MSYLEGSINELSKKIDNLASKSDHDRLAGDVERLKTDVALLQQQQTSVVNEQKVSAQRPIQTWHLVTGAIVLFTGLFFQTAGLIIAVIELLRR